jgi:hypothetical protein
MSVNVYLEDKILDEQGFKTRERTGGKPSETIREPYFGEIRLDQDNAGNLFFRTQELVDGIPDTLKPFVREITFHENFSREARRRRGIYHAEWTEAELDIVYQGSLSESYRVRMRGMDPKVMLELYRQIRAGTIAPNEDWDADQTPSEMEQELEVTKQVLSQVSQNYTNLCSAHNQLIGENTELRDRARCLAFHLRNRLWLSKAAKGAIKAYENTVG